MKNHLFCWLSVVAWCASPALAVFASGSDGSDGAFNPLVDTEINLSLATDAAWNTPSPDPGKGVYDANEWAVVFKYTTINIPAGVTVTFHNHPKGAPVIWLASGNVTIAGQVRLDGADGAVGASSYAIPGPGGFSGGIWPLSSAGFGPGGGRSGVPGVSALGGGGGYGTVGIGSGAGVIYGTASIVPLIGGSGGGTAVGAASNGGPGGAGGGAILIASSGNISLPDSAGGIFAIGGNFIQDGGTFSSGSGSGGGIRLVANQISGSGLLRALGGTVGNDGGEGRIRVEATSDFLVDRGDPPFSTTLPGSVFPDATVPTLRVTSITTSIADKPIPADPLATVVSGDVCFTSSGPVTLNIEAQNVPVNLGLTVTVRVAAARGGTSQVITSTPLAGTLALSTATAAVTFVDGSSEVQLSVQIP